MQLFNAAVKRHVDTFCTSAAILQKDMQALVFYICTEQYGVCQSKKEDLESHITVPLDAKHPWENMFGKLEFCKDQYSQNHDESMMKNIDEHSNVLPRQFLQSIDSIILYDPSDIFQTGSKRLCWQQWKPFPRSQGTCMLFIFEILKMFEAYRVALWRCDFAVAANTEQSCSNMKFWQ